MPPIAPPEGQWLLRMVELLPITPSLSSERRLDVVVLDGLLGHPLPTLRGGDGCVFLLLDPLAGRGVWAANRAVWSLGYATSPTRWQRLGIPFQGRKDPEAASLCVV